MANNISVVIITKDEIDRISGCIQSLQSFTDDIIVVDSGSSDGTTMKAQSLGAKVYKIDWKGYGPTKNHGNALAQYDWILSLDADERLTEELLDEILQLDLSKEFVYAINRQNYYLGKNIKYSGWSPDWVLRLFYKHDNEWNDNLVHEKLKVPNGIQIKKLKGKIIHHSYRSILDHKAKIEKYARLRAQIWFDQGEFPGILKRAFGPFMKGFKSYILKLGFLDGKAGWTIAKMNTLLVNRQLFYFDKLKSSKS